MKLDDSKSSASYFKAVAGLAERLASKRIAIYEHTFHYMAFGSWVIVAGRRERMLRFSYDGKDSLLSWCDASITPKDYSGLNSRTVATWSGDDPFGYVQEALEKKFAA